MRLQTIFSKFALVLLAVGILPLVMIAVFAYFQAKSRMTEEVVTYFLEKSAADTADKIDLTLLERDKDIRSWVNLREVSRALTSPERSLERRETELLLDDLVRIKEVYDLLVVADAAGRIAFTNTRDRNGRSLDPDRLSRVRGRDVSGEHWFQEARASHFAKEDWHRSSLVESVYDYDGKDLCFRYNVGFAGPIFDLETGEFLGAWYNVMNWSYIQISILDQVAKYFEQLGPYRSGYAYLWKSDANTVIGHKLRDATLPLAQGNNYESRVVEDHHLPGLHDAAASARFGGTASWRYEYPPGREKISGLAVTLDSNHEGFGWFVGVGIDGEEIFGRVNELRNVLVIATTLAALAIIFAAYALSHRITEPLRRLSGATSEVARGNLGARVQVQTQDEIGALATSFNRMAEDLEGNREKLIRAQKDVAWREMAAQVAHEIKNPLTPMKLATQHLLQTYKDGSPQFADVMTRSTSTIIEQIDSLQKIATEFGDFARLPKRDLKPIDVNEVLRDSLALYAADAAPNLRVVTELDASLPRVRADWDALRRVFINLVNNALQAMPNGGTLHVTSRLGKIADVAAVEARVIDTGAGMSPEVFARIFQPYFSTKSRGTGLGLAICKRAIDEMNGEIVVQSEAGKGTEVIVRLPSISNH
ncbi:MAG: HAMP domain-containing protein [Planctomycetes bacterium]|nr:HAMP domain-containing protein [Planctomycetota bacterium]MBI3844474.1 HAMP domain-containing protein [Planctomycetota bacterium]